MITMLNADKPERGTKMTTDTTFKEFVEKKGIDFLRLVYASPAYRELAAQFKNAKLELIAKGGQKQGRRLLSSSR